MGKLVKPDKEEIKKDFQSYKQDFLVAVKDKKRWIACLIEIGIMLLLLATDLLIKHFVYGHCLEKGDIVIIKGVIRFTAVKNTGASFGIFKDATAALTAVSLICSIFLVFFIFYSYPRKSKWLRAALVMITAGAFGNVIDRLHFGYVRDMVYFELIDFAVFNFADSCLTVGTVVLIIYILFFYTKEEEENRKKKEEAAISAKINELLNEVEEEEKELGARGEESGVMEGNFEGTHIEDASTPECHCEDTPLDRHCEDLPLDRHCEDTPLDRHCEEHSDEAIQSATEELGVTDNNPIEETAGEEQPEQPSEEITE